MLLQRSIVLATALFFLAVSMFPAHAQKPYFKKQTGDLVMLPVDEIPRGGEKFTIGGKPADPGDFPASFYQKSAEGSCTATLVGPQLLLTAAHCVGNGKTVTLSASNQTFTGACSHHDDWKDGAGDESADFAFCLLNKRMEGRQPESINLVAPSDLKPGRRLLLGGYGCTKVTLQGGGDGIFRVGLTKVTALPVGKPPNPNDMLTVSDPKAEAPAIVCPGDSGGAVYWLRSADDVKGSRRIVAVNSRVGVTAANTVDGVSYLTATFTPAFKAFAEVWKKKAEICGISGTVSVPCRR